MNPAEVLVHVMERDCHLMILIDHANPDAARHPNVSAIDNSTGHGVRDGVVSEEADHH